MPVAPIERFFGIDGSLYVFKVEPGLKAEFRMSVFFLCVWGGFWVSDLGTWVWRRHEGPEGKAANVRPSSEAVAFAS